jgi:glycosyltransferase involved in cell wall biosynthesis
MKILFVNTYDFGGAAQACMRLHIGLLNRGITSNLLLQTKYKTTIPNTYKFEKKEVVAQISFWQKVKNKTKNIAHEFKIIDIKKLKEQQQKIKTEEDVFLEQRHKSLTMFSFPNTKYDITENPLYKEADIIHLHWVADFLDYPSFFAKNTKPIVWTLHDESPFEGGEHYTESFLGITPEGKPIARTYTDIEKQWQDKILSQKQQIFDKKSNIHVVSPSNWLRKLSENSITFNNYKHYVIPYGLDTQIFNHKNQVFCRQVFNLPINKKIILFVADNLTNDRKGYIYLQRAFENIINLSIDNDIFLCAIGSKSNIGSAYKNIVEFGFIQDERLMSILYSASDVFVIPSLEDNLPNTVIESLCCGTPVIGFPIGGIPDMVQDGENGYLCPEISVDALKNTIEKFLANPSVFDSEKIAKKAQEKYALEVQAKAYIDLYQKILAK